MTDYIKAYFAGFYDPILGIKNASQKMTTGTALIFSGVGMLILYALDVVSRLILLREFMDFSMFLSIALTSFMTYLVLTFGTTGLALLIAKIQGTTRKFPELLAASTMAVIPGALVRILWGRFGTILISNAGTFFWYLGTAYIAILLYEHIKDDMLTGKKQFFTAALTTIALLAVSASY